MNPTLFISHGAPNTILVDSKTKINFKNITKEFKKPKYIVVISAHWHTKGLKIINPLAKDLMYDFYGFEEELYKIKYPIKSDINITNNLLEILKEFNPSIDKNRTSFDHGVWTPLYMMFKEINIPVIQISLPFDYSAKELLKIGEKLRTIRDDSLIIASGSITHNLRNVSYNPFEEADNLVIKFNEKIKTILKNGDISQILEFEKIENFYQMHPSYEHFLPLFVALGASFDYVGIGFNNEILNRAISMESYIFKG
ncbi:DODA-type extradiol aromatic ring-opening family dioxygenase [Arcobacter aquimarinus]|uniref:DODA-type extradiol aromatic ring-opening family dioxygenase n=1 Tax=Arcobacter aquimarinus TaxID=1315211 RepID=UPI003BAF0D8A